MPLLRYLLYVAVLALCSACGGGGGGGGGSHSNVVETTANESVASSGSFPALQQDPSNAQAMVSCQTVAPIPASTLTGTVHYQRVPLDNYGLNYDAIQNLPARGVVVQAVDAPAGQCSTTVVATALTNGDGEYGLNVPADQPVCVEVRAQLHRNGGSAGASWHVEVVDNTNDGAPYYLVDGRPEAAADRPVRNLLAGAGVIAGFNEYSGPRAAAAFAILDSVCEAIDTVIAAREQVALPLLRINWSERNTAAEGEVGDGDVGGTFYQETRYLDTGGNAIFSDHDIYLLGDAGNNTDEYDPHVINHEFGHYLVSVLSRFDAAGGEHNLGDRLDPRLAYEEGFADAFAGISLAGATAVMDDSRVYKDSLGVNQDRTFRFVLDRNYSSVKGWYSESSVYSLIYNAYDTGNSDADALSLGFAPLLNVITSDAYVNNNALLTVFTFFDLLKQQRSEDLQIDMLLASEDIEPVTDAFGSGESVANNDVAAHRDIGPIYYTLGWNSSERVCSNDQFGVFNKLSNAQFLRFSADRQSRYRLYVKPVSNGRSVVEVYQRGALIAASNAARRGADVSLDLTATGELVVLVADYDNYRYDSTSSGRYCFDVMVK